MKQFNSDFKSKLYEIIEAIENNSMAEIVVVIKAKSGAYRDVSLWSALGFMFLLTTFLMFSPVEFDVYHIYVFSFLSFLLSYFLFELIKPLKRFFINKKRLKKNTEINARAVFQKAGIRFTAEKIGVLIYVSLFEKNVKIIADRGAFTMIPGEYWSRFKNDFNSIFKTNNVSDAFLNELSKTKEVFAEYILPVENDINELPDDLEIDL
jgi:putative membrane protein